MAYSKGQQVRCSHCGRDTLLAVRAEMDGWRKVGEMYVCSLCGAKLGSVEAVAAAKTRPVAADQQGRDKVADFLGTSSERVREELVADDGVRRFCKDCEHLYQHPFHLRCLLHNRDVKPMSDCPDFALRRPRGNPE